MNTQKLLTKIAIIITLFCYAISIKAQSVAINTDGTAAATSALLDVKSTTQGILIPRMTAALRTAIATPATGLMVYQTDAPAGFYFYNGTAWTSLNGTNGTNGQGVPTGGTTNQVLSKVNSTDYNTAWVTPSGGVTLQLLATKNDNVNTLSSSSSIPDVVTFQTISSNSTLTGGNTWTSDNTFTVGAGGAGLYLVSVNLAGTPPGGAFPGPIISIDVNGNGTTQNSSSFYASAATSGASTIPLEARVRGQMTQLMYLNAGNNFKIRAASASTVAGVYIDANYSKLTIVKLN